MFNWPQLITSTSEIKFFERKLIAGGGKPFTPGFASIAKFYGIYDRSGKMIAGYAFCSPPLRTSAFLKEEKNADDHILPKDSMEIVCLWKDKSVSFTHTTIFKIIFYSAQIVQFARYDKSVLIGSSANNHKLDQIYLKLNSQIIFKSDTITVHMWTKQSLKSIVKALYSNFTRFASKK